MCKAVNLALKGSWWGCVSWSLEWDKCTRQALQPFLSLEIPSVGSLISSVSSHMEDSAVSFEGKGIAETYNKLSLNSSTFRKLCTLRKGLGLPLSSTVTVSLGICTTIKRIKSHDVKHWQLGGSGKMKLSLWNCNSNHQHQALPAQVSRLVTKLQDLCASALP